MNDRSLAALFGTEPPDGTHLVRWYMGTPTIVWRDDTAGEDDRRWFSEGRRDNPRTFAAILNGVDDVWGLVQLDQAGKRAADKLFTCVGVT